VETANKNDFRKNYKLIWWSKV